MYCRQRSNKAGLDQQQAIPKGWVAENLSVPDDNRCNAAARSKNCWCSWRDSKQLNSLTQSCGVSGSRGCVTSGTWLSPTELIQREILQRNCPAWGAGNAERVFEPWAVCVPARGLLLQLCEWKWAGGCGALVKRHREHSELGENVPGWNLKLSLGRKSCLHSATVPVPLLVTARGNKVH